MKEFTINDLIFPIKVKLPDKHCLFCEHCTDYFYDYTNGPYLFLCDKHNDGDYKNCCDFKEIEE